MCWDGRSPRGVRGGSRTLVRGGCGLGACLYGFTHYAPLGLGSCSRARAAGRGWRGVRVQPRGSAAHARAASLYVSIKSEREHRQCSVRTQHVSQSSPLRPRQGTRAAGAAGDDTRHRHTRGHTLRGESTSSSRDGGGKARIHRVPLPNVTVSTTICPDAYHKLACTCIKYLGLAHSSDATSYNTGPAVRCVRLLFA